MTEWRKAGESPRPMMAMAAAEVQPLAQVVGDIPDEHVITVAERRVSVDYPTIIQNNMNTDTVDLVLDGEWDGMSVVCYIGHPGDLGEFEWEGKPFTLPVYDTTGSIDVTVVGLSADGKTRLVTVEAKGVMNVIKSGEFEGSVPPEDQPDLLGQILAAKGDAEDAAQAATTATSAANSAASKANSAASSANSAAISANSAATKANAAAVDAQNAYDTLQPYMATIDSCANILHREVGADSVVTADDSFPCKPVEMTVYGNTRQNLWVNPPTTTVKGVTATANSDGSVTVSGTSTSSELIDFVQSYVLRPGSKYVFDVDRPLSTEADAGGFYIQIKKADGSRATIAYLHGTTVIPNVFTVPVDTVSCFFGIQVLNGKTVSGTYRVMLNEGSEAQPWCPPGLNGVDELSIVTAGKNLLDGTGYYIGDYNYGYAIGLRDPDRRTPASFPYTTTVAYRGIQAYFYAVAGETYTFSQVNAPDGAILKYQQFWDGQDTVSANATSGYTGCAAITLINGPVTFERSGLVVVLSCIGSNAVGVTWPEGFGIQVELGSTATDYEPPNITTTPIDLQGHTLNALPDGTRDELHIDGGGNVVLEKRVHREHIDADDFVKGGTEYCNAIISTQNSAYKGGVTFRSSDQRNDFAPIGNADYTNGYPKAAVYTLNGETLFRVGDGTQSPSPDEQLASVKAKVGAKGIDAMWALLEPQTIDLGTITPPTMAAPNVTAYVADDTPAEMELDYVRDINIVVDRLEKKVAGTAATVAINEATR